MAKQTEQELLKRIEQLESENSALRDKLDLIYSIVAPEDETEDDPAEDSEIDGDGGLVQIRGANEKKVN